jgi:hypothetical protein
MTRNVLRMAMLGTALMALAVSSPSWATTWMIGDNDGYGIGIPDNAPHSFNGYTANYDGRSAAEKAATNGAQFTDTYSTSHPGYGPADQGTVSTFTFSGLGTGWTSGSMWFDMADFQATTFGAVKTTYNGILQNWAFNDGFPNTLVRYFDLSQDVLDSINATGQLIVSIDRNASSDFYGFDYTMLSNQMGADTPRPGTDVPEPSTLLILGSGLLGLVSMAWRRS